MLGYIWRLLVGKFKQCDHEFEIECKSKVSSEFYGEYLRYHLRCKKCGDVFLRNLK